MPFSFSGFSLLYSGQENFVAPLLTAYHQPVDRKTVLRSLSHTVTLTLSPQQLAGLPSNFDGWRVERSADGGVSWFVVSGWIRDSFYYVDIPPSAGVFQYRAQMKLSGGATTVYSSVVSVSSGQWGDADNISTQEVDPNTGLVKDRWVPGQAFPNGIGAEKHTGLGISEGSFAGAYGEGGFYLRSRELQVPQIVSNVPACGATGVLLPLVSITYTIEDLPNPGGSGIDDSTLVVFLSVTKQFGGVFILIHNGGTEPWAAATPQINCVSVLGADVLLDRDVTITVPAGYIKSDDVVSVKTIVRDLDGNELQHTCSFTMQHLDQEDPTVTNQNPTCGTGLTASDTNRIRRDTSYSFLVSDPDSGVNVNTIQVYHGLSATGPWTQVLQNGATFLLGFTGTVVADGLGGFNVTVVRPVADPLWPANTNIYFRVTADDLQSNSVEDICGFKTRNCVTITKVVPLANDLLIVEFSAECEDGELLRGTDNYIIEPDVSDDDAVEVMIRQIIPQRFLPPEDPLQTGPQRLGVGNPKYVLIETTRYTPWGLYRIRTQNLVDEHGEPHCSWTDAGIKFRAQFTALDEARANLEDEEQLGADTIWRAALSAIMFSQQQISGVYVDNDWDEI